MKDLSREEKLEQQIYKMADACGDKKWMRVKRTFFVICGVIYLIMIYYCLENGVGISNIKISDIDFEALFYMIFGLTFGVGFVAAVIMIISYAVLGYIIDGAMKDEKAIYKKIGELEAIKFNKYNASEDEKTKEAEKQLEDLKIMLAPIVGEYPHINNLEDLKVLLTPIIEEYHAQQIKERLAKEVNKNGTIYWISAEIADG